MNRAHFVVIHGGNGTGPQMERLAAALRPYGEVHSPNLPGHGGRSIPESFSIKGHAEDLAAWLDENGVERAHFFGYSVGGYVALYLARHMPGRVLGVCAIATKYVFDASTVEHWTRISSTDWMRKPGNPRAAEMERIHAPEDWTRLVEVNAELYRDLGRDAPLKDRDLAAIAAPVMVVGANRDQLVPWAETLALGAAVPGSKVVGFEGPAHPIAAVPCESVAKAYDDWRKASAGLPALVLLHGANGCAAELRSLAARLRDYARVLVPDLPGHGGRPLPERLSIAGTAADVLALLDREGIERAFFVGYSLGGYAALYLARHHPQRTLGACSVATKFAIDAETVKRWVYLAQPARLSRPGNARAGELLRSHGSEWPRVALANAAFFTDLGREPELTDADLAAIDRPVLLVNSSRDTLVAWEETVDTATRVPGARLVMFYGVAHPFHAVPADAIGRAIGAWVAGAARA